MNRDQRCASVSVLVGLLAATCLAETGGAQALRRLYDDSLLDRLQAIYKPNIEWNLDSLLVPLLTPAEQQRLAGVQLVVPLRDPRADPLSYFSYWLDSRPTVSLSVFSIRFFDDVAVAYSWLESNGHSSETILDYLGVLKYRPPTEFSGGRYPRMFASLGIPADAALDPVGGDVANKILKSAILFVVAHELGHLYYGHNGAPADVQQAQENEVAADAFAIALFRRLGIAPLGIVYLFEVPVYLGKNRGDFSSDDAWFTYQRTVATHPLSGARLRHLSRELQGATDDFLKYESDETAARARIAAAALQLDSLGTLFDDPDLQRFHRIRAERIPLAELQPGARGDSWVPH